MKANLLILSTFLSFLFLATSCVTENAGSEGTVTNYWESNALTQMQLRGNVKTMSEDENVYNFNTSGNLSSQTDNDSETTYEYQNGVLVRSIQTYNNVSSTTDTIYYEYENVGKYIPIVTMQMFKGGLYPSLSAIIMQTYRIDYDFHGTDLWIIASNKNDGQFIPLDTSIIAYSGNYPSSYNGGSYFFNNISYASNAMFLTYNEGYNETSYNDLQAYTFVPNDKYLLVSTLTYTYSSSFNQLDEVTLKTYTYNSHFDPDKVVIATSYIWGTVQNTLESEFEYSDYVYDSNQNWTSRKYRYKNDGNWSDYETKTRTLEYY